MQISSRANRALGWLVGMRGAVGPALLALLLLALPDGPAWAARVALVVGNDSYAHADKLRNARADAQAMAAGLKDAGYDVDLRLDRSQTELLGDIRTLRRRIQPGDEVVVYFSGHGVEARNEAFLLPVDFAAQNEDELLDMGVSLRAALDRLSEARPRFTLAIVDACRDNPFARGTRSIGSRNLAVVPAATGEMIIYAAGRGQTALDVLGPNDASRNGLFARVFVKEMAKPGVSIRDVLYNVQDQVATLAEGVKHLQVPSVYDQARGSFYFHPAVQAAGGSASGLIHSGTPVPGVGVLTPVPGKAGGDTQVATIAPLPKPAEDSRSLPPPIDSSWPQPVKDSSSGGTTEIVVATVNNGHMIEMQKLTRTFEEANPDIRVKWVVLEEGVLRQRVATDVSTNVGQFDVMTIGMYDTPIWARKGLLRAIETPAAYDVDDLLPSIRAGLSVDGKLYAAPFYGESSMLMYRTDLAQRAGVAFPERPSWSQVRDAAARMADPANGLYGICLRGKPGWGDNMALITTVVNAFGGQWFDMAWKPSVDSKPWHDAIGFYVDLLHKYGPPGSEAKSFNEILALFNEGKCAMWDDATIAAAFITDPRQSKVADKVAFTQAPSQVTAKGANWLWAWALGIPAGTTHAAAAQRFVAWATSKEYIRLVASVEGWAHVPTGTRKSTYANPEFQKAAKFAAAEITAISSADPYDATLPRSPYVGVQFAAIPEFQSIGITVGQQMSAALAGKQTVDAALKASQSAADRTMRSAGYYK